jgi:hypothetical protein
MQGTNRSAPVRLLFRDDHGPELKISAATHRVAFSCGSVKLNFEVRLMATKI